MKVVVKCRWSEKGCTRQVHRDRVHYHEQVCPHRVVTCPGRNRHSPILGGLCQWSGSILSLSRHIGPQTTCIQKLHCNEEDEQFTATSWIGDYNSQQLPGHSVFSLRREIGWKPIFLSSREVVQYMIYITIQRKGTGLWFIMIRSYREEHLLKRIRVRLELRKKGDANSVSSIIPQQKYLYEGGVVSHNMTNAEAMQSGRILLLNDGQVELLKTRDTIFEYHITVSIIPGG